MRKKTFQGRVSCQASWQLNKSVCGLATQACDFTVCHNCEKYICTNRCHVMSSYMQHFIFWKLDHQKQSFKYKSYSKLILRLIVLFICLRSKFWQLTSACHLPLKKREGELKQKCFAQLILGSLLGTRRSAVDQFVSLSLVKVPEVFSKVNSAQIPSRFESSELVLGVKFTDFGKVTNLRDCV